MSKRNKEKRAAKKKIRAAGQAGGDRWRASAAPSIEEFIELLSEAARERAAGRETGAAVRLLTGNGRYARHERLMDAAADVLLREAVSARWSQGWQPYDVFQIATRHAADPTVSLVVDAIAAEIAQRAAAAVHPRWRDQLARVGAEVWWQSGQPWLGQWAQRHGRTRAEALITVVAALALLGSLPRLAEIPLPDLPRAGVDEKMLARVRALLAKAESTQFPEEAEALSAKAQELMSRYSFERALVEPGERRALSARRFWLDNPYLSAKSSLVSAVASANRCRAVFHERLGFVSLVGHEVDLDIVELLSTSLLVQATEAMLAAGRQVSHTGQSRTRSFRQSFLLAYAGRIGERLTEADRETGEKLADDRLLPVLARRSQEVEAFFGEMFPSIVNRRQTVSNGAGWRAGRAAADRARLQHDRAALSR